MLLVRCKDKHGQLVLTADRYSWSWVRYRKVKNSVPEIFDELPDGEMMESGDYQGVNISVRRDNGPDWEQFCVGPNGYGQIIIEDERRHTRDNFRLKIYDKKEGLQTC